MPKKPRRHYEAVPRPQQARVALYLRYSSPRQPGSTIEKQRMLCMEYLAREPGWQVVAEYCEPAQTAKHDDITKRPQFARMLADAGADQFDVALVESIDRWGRAEAAHFVSLGLLREAGVYWATADGAWNSESIRQPGFSTAFLINVGEASQTSRLTSKKTTDGKRSRALQGYMAGGHPPYGYMLEPPQVDAFGRVARRKLIPDPATFPALAEIAELRMQGWGCQAIAVELARRGYRVARPAYGRSAWKFDGPTPAKLAGRPLQSSTIQHILSNRFYVEFMPGSGQGIITTLDGEEIAGLHIPAWSQDTWERMEAVKATLHGAPRNQPRYHYQYPLGGLMVCLACATGIRCWHRSKKRAGQVYREYRYYACYAKNRVPCPARTHYTLAHVAENAIGDLLTELVQRVDWREELVQWLDTAPAGPHPDAERAALEREQQALNLQHRVGGVDDATYERETRLLQSRLRALPQVDTHERHRTLALAGAERLADIASCWAATTLARQHDMAHLLFEPHGIIWDHDQARIVGVRPYQEFRPAFSLALEAWQSRGQWLWDHELPVPDWLAAG